INKEWDSTREWTIPQPATASLFRQQVRVDSITSRTETQPAKRKKLFGRIADAISNKERKDTSTNSQVVKTVISADNSAEAEQYNRQQLKKINEYYNE